MDPKYEYFINQTNKKLDEIDHKLDQLISFRMMLVGGSFAVSLIASLLFNFIHLYLGAK